MLKDVEAVWNGDSVFAAWGYTDGIDGTSGEQPRGTIVDGMFCHELGQYEKQSSCWCAAGLGSSAALNRALVHTTRLSGGVRGHPYMYIVSDEAVVAVSRFQAKSALTEIKNSIMFNGPRAMIVRRRRRALLAT